MFAPTFALYLTVNVSPFNVYSGVIITSPSAAVTASVVTSVTVSVTASVVATVVASVVTSTVVASVVASVVTTEPPVAVTLIEFTTVCLPVFVPNFI